MKTDFKRRVWVSVGVILGATVVTVVAIFFLSNDLTAQADAIIAQKKAVAAQDNASIDLAGLEEDAPKAADYASAMNQLWSTEDGLIGFSQWIQALGQSDNVVVQSSFNGDPVSSSGATPGSVAFMFTAQGSMTDVMGFMEDLESRSIGFLVSIGSFSVTYQNPDYTLSGSGNVYFQ